MLFTLTPRLSLHDSLAVEIASLWLPKVIEEVSAPQRSYRAFGGTAELWKSIEPRVILSGPSETGKTLSCSHFLDHLCWQYPGLQAAVIRKVYADMNSTVLQTFEKKVLSPLDGVKKFGGEKAQFYDYPNGSRAWVGGLDKPGKVLSSERDLIYVNQVEELTLQDWETLSTRTTGRAGVLQPARLIGDCNPAAPTHWIKGLAAENKLRFIESRHEDNPVLFNPETGKITEQGKRTMAVLDSLTGVRYLRLRKGLWAAAEGIVFDTYDPKIHYRAIPEGMKYHIAGVDWGFTNPGVIQVWGVDGDKRMYRRREIYRTRRTIDWWIGQALALRDQYQIKKFVCDPSEPGYIQQFRNAGLEVVEAFNDIAVGIDNLLQRLMVQPDGLPRLFLCPGALTDRDESLSTAHKPTCLEEEIEIYAYPKAADGKPLKEIPIDDNNHACDAMRYVAAHLDLQQTEPLRFFSL